LILFNLDFENTGDSKLQMTVIDLKLSLLNRRLISPDGIIKIYPISLVDYPLIRVMLE
jgi:hypothetical protein